VENNLLGCRFVRDSVCVEFREYRNEQSSRRYSVVVFKKGMLTTGNPSERASVTPSGGQQSPQPPSSKNNQVPRICINGHQEANGSIQIRKSELVASNGIVLKMDQAGLSWILVAFDLKIYNDGVCNKMQASGAAFTQEMKRSILNLQGGDYMYIDNIRAKVSDGTFRVLASVKVEVEADDEVPKVLEPSNGQTMQDSGNEEAITFAEEMPTFAGGDTAFQAYLSHNIMYPQMEKEMGKTGTVYVYFEVGKDGTISNVQTKKGVTDAPGFSKEAERVIRSMPKWTPGKMDGRYVKVGMTIPVRFELR
jgi:TonB family protein